MDIEDMIALKTTTTPKNETNQNSDRRDSGGASHSRTYPFNFPFPPYSIQSDLMRASYETFEQSKFALLESPTGTGKSLSLICSSLTWLRDHQKKTKSNLESKKDKFLNDIEELKKEEETSNDWLGAQTKRRELTKQLDDVNKELDVLIKFELRNEARRHARLHGVPLENYSSFMEMTSKKGVTIESLKKEYETNLLGGKYCANGSDTLDDAEVDIDKKITQETEDQIKPKIYYASRTHSQLSQFINEVKKTKFSQADESPSIKVVPLASRANLCVNLEVLKLRDPNAINERCMELQKETKPENRCPYIKTKQVNLLKNDILSSVQDIEDLVNRGRALGSCPYYASRLAVPEAELVVLPYNNLLHRETRQASSLDLKENIVILDEAHNILETICSIHSAPISGLQLIGAHSILSRYYQRCHTRMSPRNAAMVKSIVQCLKTLIGYLNNPREHLRKYDCPTLVDVQGKEDNPSTRVNGGDINQVKNNEGKICKIATKHEEFMVDIVKFIGASGVDRYNVFKILDFLHRSQLARKLIGFFRQDTSVDLLIELHGLQANIDKTPLSKESVSPKKKRRKISAQSDTKPPKKTTEDQEFKGSECDLTSLNFLGKCNPGLVKRNPELQSYPIYALIEFLKSLTGLANDGKMLTDFHERDIVQSVLRFTLLNPSSQFKQMAEEARSVVLAGGTMQPFDEFLDLLFGPLGVDRERIKIFSCGHVISPNQLFVASLSTGSSGKSLELSYKVRSSFDTIDEIGRTIMQISMITPGGMVCFLPSYDYEQLCFNRWSQIGLISKIETRSKHVFREPRQAVHLKPIWDEYCKKIEKGKAIGRGALLFCVVGGKMSEGINFNDDLGRCVIMVGLPYANVKSCELQQKMSYYDRVCKKPNGIQNQTSAGQQYYENLCIKGINQSIGRAIRHRQDYAAIILIDRRYSSKSSIKSGLPGWMHQSLTEYSNFDPMLTKLKSFYSNINL